MPDQISLTFFRHPVEDEITKVTLSGERFSVPFGFLDSSFSNSKLHVIGSHKITMRTGLRSYFWLISNILNFGRIFSPKHL